MRYPPDEFEIVEDGILMSNQIGPDRFEHQFVDIGLLSVSSTFNLIHKDNARKARKLKLNLSQKRQMIVSLKNSTTYVHDSTSRTTPYQIILQQLVDRIEILRKKGARIHLLTHPHRKRIYLLIVVVMYHPSRILETSSHEISEEQSSISVESLQNLKNLLQFSKNGIHFSSKIKKHPQRIVVDSDFVTDLVGKLDSNQLLDNPLGQMQLTPFIKEITYPAHLAIFARQKEYDHFISMFRSIKSHSDSYRMIKIGGSIPPGFQELEIDKLGLGLIELIDQGFLEDYNDLFQLASELFDIQNLGEEFIKFWKEYKQSLDQKEFKELTIDKLYNTIKSTPMDKFEIPISPRTKHRLLLFLDSFIYRKTLRREMDYSPPGMLYLPLKDCNSDILLLFFLLRTSWIAGNDYSVIWIDHPLVFSTIYRDNIQYILSRLLHEMIIISKGDFPTRKVLSKMDKIFIRTQRQHFYFLDQLAEARGFNVVEGRDYFVSASDEMYQLIDDYSYHLYKEEAPEIDEEVSGKELMEIDSEEISEETETDTQVKEIEGKIDFKKQTPEEAQDSEKSDKESPPVDPDMIIDELGRDNETPAVKSKIQEDITSRHVITEEEDDTESKSPDIGDQAEKTKPTVTSSPSPTSNAGEKPVDPSTDDTNEKKVELFNTTFGIEDFYNSERSYGIDLINLIEEQSQIFSIVNRLKHASKNHLLKEEFTEEEQQFLDLAVERELLTMEVTDKTKYRMIANGKKLYTYLIDKLRNYEQQVGHLTDEDLSDILFFQQSYSRHSYVISLLHSPIILGIKYFKHFRLVPPQILSLMNILSKIKFRIEDPDHFADIYRARFVPIFNQYQKEIEDDKSKVRQEYIDTTEKQIPLPSIGNKEDKSSESGEMDTEWDMRPKRVKQKKKQKRKDEVISDDQTDDVDQHLEQMKTGSPRYPRKKIKEEQPEIIEDHTPEQMKKELYDSIIGAQHKEFEPIRDQFELKFITQIRDEDVDHIPGIYHPSSDFDLKESLPEINFQYLNISTRIKNILASKGINTIHDFVSKKFTTSISGIGASYLEEIEEIQQLLVSDHLAPDHLPYIIEPEGIAGLVTKGADLPTDLLSSEIYYKPVQLIIRCNSIIDENEDVKGTVFLLSTEILSHLEMNAAETLEEVLVQLDSFQNTHFPLLFDEDSQKELHFRHVYALQQQLEDDKTTIEEIQDNLKQKISQLLLSIQFFREEIENHKNT